MNSHERISRHLPVPLATAPFAQLDYLLSRMLPSVKAPQRKKLTYSAKYYRKFIRQTLGAKHPLDIVVDWHEDALADFQHWIEHENPPGAAGSLAPLSVKGIVSGVKVIMDFAYANSYIDVRVYNLTRPVASRSTAVRSSYSDEELRRVLEALQPAIKLSLSLCDGYKLTGKGTSPLGKPSTFHKREDLLWYWSNVVGNWTITRREVVRREKHFYRSATKAFGTWNNFLTVANTQRSAQDVLSASVANGEDPRYRPADFSDPDNRVWYFENVMNCQPLPSAALPRKCTPLRDAVRQQYGDVESWYHSMGTTLYIDHDVIIPLLFKLASETGLNAESLFSLPRDCFVKDDALTGQNYIVYWKVRSKGEKRFPVTILDDDEVLDASDETDDAVRHVRPLGIKQSVIVEKTINDILALTAPLVASANSQHSNLLFIYQLRGGHGKDGRVGKLTAGAVSKWSHKFFFDGRKRNIRNPNDVVNISRFRPTLVTEMVSRGYDIFAISVLLGHRSVFTTAIYLDKHGLEPRFEIEMKSQLENIRKNHYEAQAATGTKPNSTAIIRIYPTSGLCGCRDPFNPPETIRRATNFEEGKSCGYYSMCLTCKHIVITEEFIPKLFKHLYELELELDKGLGSEPIRDRLYLRQIAVLRHVLTPDFIFSLRALKRADEQVNHYIDAIYDDFIYH